MPVVFGMSTYTAMLTVDTAIMGRISPEAQGVTGIGDVAFLLVALTLSGLSVGTQVMVARRLGEGDHPAIGAVFDNAIRVAMVFGALITIALILPVEAINNLLYESPELRAMGLPFIEVKFLATLPYLISAALQGLFIGVTETVHFFVMTLIRSALNIFLDFALVFGLWGFPELGVTGAAWASTIAVVVSMVYLLVVALLPHYRRKYYLFRNAFDFSRLKRLVNLSTPAGARNMVGIFSYLVFFRIIEGISAADLAAANISRSVFNIIFMPTVGIGFAVSVLVSKALGEGNPDDARSKTFTAARLALWATIVPYVLMAVFARPLGMVFTNDPEVLEISIRCFRISGLFLLIYPYGMILAFALEGAGKVWSVFLIEAGCCAVYVVCAWLFGVYWAGGVVGAYSAEIVYWVLCGLVAGLLFARGSWKTVKV